MVQSKKSASIISTRWKSKEKRKLYSNRKTHQTIFLPGTFRKPSEHTLNNKTKFSFNPIPSGRSSCRWMVEPSGMRAIRTGWKETVKKISTFLKCSLKEKVSPLSVHFSVCEDKPPLRRVFHRMEFLVFRSLLALFICGDLCAMCSILPL